jgi:tRNA pseudouridine55 synthase
MSRRFAMGAASETGERAARRRDPLDLDTFHGLITIDKPVGPTSHDIVLHARRRLGSPGAGHLGTLDPAASGLLVLALGAATRALQVWAGGEKTYEATLRLGVVTRSQDLTGEVIDQRPVRVDEEAVRAASRAFTGELKQVPPMVSAVKVGGERLHALARRGIEVTRAPRRIHVTSWEWLDFALPLATFRVRVSPGTYVRTLAHDLGQALGCGAALAELRRLRSEPFGLERALPFSALDERPREELLREAGIPLDEALGVLPAVTLDPTEAAAIGTGASPAVDAGSAPLSAGPRSIVFRDREGKALALGELVPDPRAPARALAQPHVVFPWAVRTGR